MVTQRAPAPILLEAAAPPWAQRLVLVLQQTFLPLRPIQPTRLWPVVSADLPDPGDWPGALVYVTDLAKVGVSDGVAWTDTLGGPL